MSTEAPSRYTSGSVGNMIRSLVVIGALMALVILIVPRVNSVSQPPVDAAGTAQSVAAETKWPLQIPMGLPDGWRATSVRYVRSTDGVMTWHAGYTTPDNQSVAIEQAMVPTVAWVRAEVNRARVVGTVDAGGRTWTKYVRDGKLQNSLVNDGATPAKDLTTIVTGTGTFEQLQLFADKLGVVKPAS
ncbi:MAG: DUF4245 domain-containing protein [Nostocoides sp.]